ncbi:MAG: hypothetical protein WBM87_09580 [Woeseiaceae bacterium]
MDKLANRLRHDADNIDAKVSDELDRRIRASLNGVMPATDQQATPPPARPAGFWWASSLTGIAAAVAVIAIINSQQAEPVPQATPANIFAAVPVIDLQAETAMMTSPLQQELDALQSDIRKAERRVREEIGL